MFEFFDFIVNIVSSIADGIVSIIESVITLFGQMLSGITFVYNTIYMLPPFCQGALVTIVSLSLLSVLLSAFLDFS